MFVKQMYPVLIIASVSSRLTVESFEVSEYHVRVARETVERIFESCPTFGIRASGGLLEVGVGNLFETTLYHHRRFERVVLGPLGYLWYRIEPWQTVIEGIHHRDRVDVEVL